MNDNNNQKHQAFSSLSNHVKTNWKTLQSYPALDYLIEAFTEEFQELGIKISQTKLLRCLCKVGTNNIEQMSFYLLNPIKLLSEDNELGSPSESSSIAQAENGETCGVTGEPAQ